MNFKVGDVCELIASDKWPARVGSFCTVVAVGEFKYDGKGPYFGYCVANPDWIPRPAKNRWFVFGNQLRLKRPPEEYDGNQVGSWDLIPWQPKKERA
jgi:hypothetical protein